ncbi:hypothetical protein QS713_00365 [Gleimia hominis]|uniref:Uncharacterized protein n=1 Tax=Gleimia hominis TaxID=595468 RepID=A0ABU3I818_9ACTO|nr:hypothetical protein [Gleimia hominis]MDT3766529.1 hypothetical protein [Gleimia hominis]
MSFKNINGHTADLCDGVFAKDAFSAIERIPDEVLAKNDPQALKAWYESLGQDRVNWIACGSAIGLAIVTNFTPAKIVKIKSAIKTLGGAVTFAKKVYSLYKKARAGGLTAKTALNAAITGGAQAAGPDVKEALLDLFGVGAVIGACGIGD